MSKYSVILFDMDGTIANTDEMIVQTFLVLYKLYRKDAPATPIEQIYYFSGPPIKETLKKEFPDMDQKFIWDEFHRISWELYPKYTKGYPRCRESLLYLKEKGYRLGVVTNKIHRTTEYCIKLLNLEGLFDVVIGADDVSVGKPNPEGMNKAMHTLGENNMNKVLYIGDNESDLLTANNSGCDCALVNWGPRKLPDDIKCKYRISSFDELVEAIEHE